MVDDYYQAIHKCKWTYQQLLRKGFAPEMARMVLPQSMYTEWYWSGSLIAFSRFCNLRLEKDAQEETRFIAREIDKECQKLIPISWEFLVNSKNFLSEKAAE